MTLPELLFIAVGLAMDAFSVSICKGLSLPKAALRYCLLCGIYFGFFQALMPLLGWVLGIQFQSLITKVDHWIAFLLLSLLGLAMIRDAGEPSSQKSLSLFTPNIMLTLSIATSIDALAVGISLAMAGNVNIWVAIALIGVITFTLSGVGVKIGNVFGSRFEKKAQIAGGVILILLGLKILLEHLGILA